MEAEMKLASDDLKNVDIAAIFFGCVGLLTNGLLFLTAHKHGAMNEKIRFLFKSLAVIDCLSSFSIPLLWFNLAYSANPNIIEFEPPSKVLILLLLCFSIINIPNPIIIMVGLLRYELLTSYRVLRRTPLWKIRIACLLVCIFNLVIPLVCYLVALAFSQEAAKIIVHVLHRIEAGFFVLFHFLAILVLSLLVLKLIRLLKFSNLPVLANTHIKSSIQTVVYLLVFNAVFGFFPVVFCVELIVCGSWGQSKMTNSNFLCTRIAQHNPFMIQNIKLEFAIMFLCLSLMSIANGMIILLQPSFRSILKGILKKIFSRCLPEEYPASPAITGNYILVKDADFLTDLMEETSDDEYPPTLRGLQHMAGYGTFAQTGMMTDTATETMATVTRKNT